MTTTPPVDSPARVEILRLHEKLFRKQRALIQERVHGYTDEFRRYERRYLRAVSRFERLASVDEVVEEALGADVVHVGDYHTLRQAQRAFVQLVRRVADRGRSVVLGLELVQARHQEHLDRYLKGRLSERGFLKRIEWARHHPFDVWPNFRPIFDVARALGLPVVALERAGGGTLEVRDRFWARRLAALLNRRPGALVLTLVGQLHCAPSHLPREVSQLLPDVKQLVVYQNAEPLWFELQRQGCEHDVQALKVRDGEYCLVNVSPLVAQQTFLDWVEAEGDFLDAGEPLIRFREIARFIAEFLDLELGDALDHVQVYTSGDLSFLATLQGQFSSRELALIRRQILDRESYFIPRANIAYLANLSVNHAAEEAAHFVRHVVAGDELEPQRGLIDSFYGRALEEAFAFFGSRLVNARRKAPRTEDLLRLRRTGSAGEKSLAALVLAHQALEAGRPTRSMRRVYESEDIDLFNAVTHVLGYALGDRLYHALMQGLLPKEEARELFMDPLDNDGDAFHTYFHLARRFANVRLPRQV